jgi:hypothetical protein
LFFSDAGKDRCENGSVGLRFSRNTRSSRRRRRRRWRREEEEKWLQISHNTDVVIHDV